MNDPSNIHLDGQINVPDPSTAQDLAVDGDILYLSKGTAGLFTFRMLSETDLEYCGFYQARHAILDLIVQDGLAYVIQEV